MADRIERILGSPALGAIAFGVMLSSLDIDAIPAITAIILFANYTTKLEQIAAALRARKDG